MRSCTIICMINLPT